jgi:hypothetical protein
LLKKIQNDQKAIFPLTLEQIFALAVELREILMAFALKADKLENSYDARLLLTSIFELYSVFIIRPILVENSSKILHITQPKMEVANFRKLVNLLDASILENYETSQDFFKFNDSNFAVQLIEAFTSFLKNYNHVSHITQTFKIASHYGNPDLYRAVHQLFKYIQYKQEFPQILAFSIMNFAIQQKNELQFQLFASTVNEFLNSEKKTSIKFEVVKIVLKSLPPFFKKINAHENRMVILKFIKTFMGKCLQNEAAEAQGWIMKVTSDMTLREKEIEAVDRFNKEIWG